MAQILIQLPAFYKNGYRLTPDFHFRDPYFRTILRRWVPVLFASCIFFVNQLIANKFASGLEDGSVSALKNSIIFWQLPQGIFGASLSTVLFPKMSREAAENDLDGLRRRVVEDATFGKNRYLWKNRIYKLQKTTIMKRFYLLTALFALTAAGCVKVDLVDATPPPSKSDR